MQSAAFSCRPTCRWRAACRTDLHAGDQGRARAHDENITFDQAKAVIGAELAFKVRTVSLALYQNAAEYALSRGIIIADTKFEFGIDGDGDLRLMDEVLTADSSRFWPADEYQEGASPPSFDKQFVRDWLRRGTGQGRRRPICRRRSSPAPRPSTATRCCG